MVQNLPANAGDTRNRDSIPGLGRSLGGVHGNPLQYSCLEISDGAPNESVETVRQAVLDVEKQGFAIVAVSIEPQYDPSLMYHRNVNLTDMSRLAVDLGKMVKKAIADNTNRKIQ